jgi:ABC-type uncharacterized transport system permease subunit
VAWTDRQFFAAAVVVYGVSMVYSVFLWRKGFRQDDRVNYFLMLAAAVLHTTAMIQRGFSLERCPVNNLYEASTFVAWTIVAAFLLLGLWPKLRFLGAFASPVLFGIGVFSLMPALDQGRVVEMNGTWSSLHAALILLAYGAFGLSSVAALMYLSEERDLKLHKLRAILSRLPPIQRLERVMTRLSLVGFILLTVGLAVGGYYLQAATGSFFASDPKVIWSLLVWSLYLVLLVMNLRFAQIGHRFAMGAIGGFLFVLLTFWGSNLLSPIHNP